MVLDLRLPDMSGFDLLTQLRDEASLSDIPVVVFTGRELSPEEDAELHTMARSVVVKGVESPERLLDETALFLHRVVGDLLAEKQRMLERLYSSDEDLQGRTVLLVDDDARNIFALSSVLERRGLRVLTATTGSEAVALLDSTPEVAIVLMDIMMQEMDGYETMQVIRGKAAYRRLPIVALTTKAMKGDREKCLDAGASDYLAKPVNTEQLLSVLRMWLHRWGSRAMNAHEPVNILLVDDQPAKLLSYEVMLRDLGENLIKASSGRQALEQILKNDIAVVLIDVVMPDLNGFELAAMIRDHPRFHTISMIFVSAVSVTELDRIKGYQYGAVDYVSVPVVPDLLRAKVKVFAERYRKTRELERLNAELERRVEERTAALAEANLQLEQRVEERTRERAAALAQVHEMQKMESLGQLTGGLAHDFNNLLMGILGSLDYLAKQPLSDPKAKHFLTAARESAERGAALTRRLLAFARRQELRPEPVDVQRLGESMAEMLQRSLGPTIQIEMEFDRDLAMISVDPNQLELAILNLALNARDAMPDGGRLRIAAQRESGATSLPSLADGDYVRMTVTDTDIGMDAATLARCSEPFFTTKEVGRGTGLGLSSVLGLAAQSGGGMRISSTQGKGTAVELWFPVATGATRPEKVEAEPAQNGATPRYRVLVVDDEPLVAKLTASMLEHLGHASQVVPSGASALNILSADRTIDAVIADYAMPDMTGAELAVQISRLRPGMPVILATGYADFPNSGAQSLPRLSKPFGAHELQSALTSLNQRPLAS